LGEAHSICRLPSQGGCRCEALLWLHDCCMTCPGDRSTTSWGCRTTQKRLLHLTHTKTSVCAACCFVKHCSSIFNMFGVAGSARVAIGKGTLCDMCLCAVLCRLQPQPCPAAWAAPTPSVY
jgi:hypothetical protein